MRKLIILTLGLLLLAGCASDQADATTQNVTIFGRLSQFVQLGSTAETIAHQERTSSFFVYADAEVLMNRPANVSVTVIDIETGEPRSDLQLSLALCNAVDPEIGGIGSCDTEYDGDLYRHDLTANFTDGAYLMDGFDWERPGYFGGELTITLPDGSVETMEMGAGVYPQRPPSSNAFELINISLPFIVIGLFLIGMRLFSGKLMQSSRPHAAIATD